LNFELNSIHFYFSEIDSPHENLLPISILNNGNQSYTDENSTVKRLTISRSEAKRLHRKMKKYQIGEATDDVRLCIMCLRAIMNNQVNINLNRIENSE
jgi:hypothetical protein